MQRPRLFLAVAFATAIIVTFTNNSKAGQRQQAQPQAAVAAAEPLRVTKLGSTVDLEAAMQHGVDYKRLCIIPCEVWMSVYQGEVQVVFMAMSRKTSYSLILPPELAEKRSGQRRPTGTTMPELIADLKRTVQLFPQLRKKPESKPTK